MVYKQPIQELPTAPGTITHELRTAVSSLFPLKMLMNLQMLSTVIITELDKVIILQNIFDGVVRVQQP